MADDSSRKRKARMQLSAVEKTEMRKSLKRGSSQTEMDRVFLSGTKSIQTERSTLVMLRDCATNFPCLKMLMLFGNL